MIKNSKKGNDDVINDMLNLSKTFSFRRFSDVVGMYKSDNITKTPQYRFYDYLRKRNVSLTVEFRKWMERNKRVK